MDDNIMIIREGTIVCFGPGQTAGVETTEDEVSPPVYGIIFIPT